MRIGIEVQHMMRPRKYGTDIANLEILKALQQTNSIHDYYLYAQPDKNKAPIDVKDNMHLQLAGPASFHTWEQEILPGAIADDRINLLHCTCNTAPIAVNIPLVVTIHDIMYLQKNTLKQGTWYQRFGNLYKQWNVPRIAKRAEAIITVSDYEKQKIVEQLNVAPEKVKTIYNAYGKHFTAERPEEEMKAFSRQLALPERYVLFFGNTASWKNMPNVLKALDILHQRKRLDFTLVMPGISDASLLTILASMRLEHLSVHIQTMGYIPNQELPNLYRLAEAFLYPSLSESTGIPILESMACGTPVITSNTTAMPEIAGDKALLIDPREPGQIASMILKVLEDSAFRQKSVQDGLNRAAKFSWAKTTSEVLRTYESILG